MRKFQAPANSYMLSIFPTSENPFSILRIILLRVGFHERNEPIPRRIKSRKQPNGNIFRHAGGCILADLCIINRDL